MKTTIVLFVVVIHTIKLDKSCDHLLYIYRAIDGDTENALLYVTDGVRSHLAAENIDHFQIWEELVLETPFQDTFVIEETLK